MDDEFYMNLALREAKKASEIDEVPVGAIIVNQQDKVIGYGHNNPISSSDPTGHAEINAIRMASKAINNYRLADTTIYVTIEPCIMCMGAIINARIKKIVFGTKDPKWGAAGSLYNMAEDKRLNHHPKVVNGICRDQAKEIIQSFFRHKRSK
ncbi:MAG: nucleoside deaminase [Desulfobacteraceae bacterium]|nr:nucleoside deaminase [Desulfobacteraceae bacterium]